jgi:hypothetical protein
MLAAASIATLALVAQSASAQVVQQAVGGVSINAEGVLSAPTQADDQALQALRAQALEQAPAELAAWTDLRAVSLKQLEAQLAECAASGTPIPQEVKYLAGLQRVQYVFVYPERNDVVLAGPAEGWEMDALGNVVGATSRRPVLLLDDLMVALRTREASRLEAISCSIDPTAAGVQRLRAAMSRVHKMGDPNTIRANYEQALGAQTISVTGVPASSHFARAMVAADFRMKRLAMHFDPAPIGNLPSFLELTQANRRGTKSMMPRWWLAPNYEPLARDAEGLAWELRGPGVQCLTEEDHFDSEGKRAGSTQASSAAVRWANTLTERYAELAQHDSAFGMLRNVMDLAVVAALLEKEQLLAGVALPQLMAETPVASYPAPQSVDSQVSFVKQSRDWVVSASGGVSLLPWQVADQTEQLEGLGAVRTQLAAPADRWYW